jgi:hypothetical protein
MEFKRPRFKKLEGVPTLKVYPVEGIEAGLKVGMILGGAIGLLVFFLLDKHYVNSEFWHYLSSTSDGDSILNIVIIFLVPFVFVGAIAGICLGALVDKLRGKWE